MLTAIQAELCGRLDFTSVEVISGGTVVIKKNTKQKKPFEAMGSFCGEV